MGGFERAISDAVLQLFCAKITLVKNRRWELPMRIKGSIVVAAFLFLHPLSSIHAERRPIGAGIDPIYSRWLTAKAACDQPGPWTLSKSAACDRWYQVTEEMQRNGWCYGGTAAREPWHICTTGDQQAQAENNAGMARGAELDRRESLAIRQMSPADLALYRIWLRTYRPCREEVRGSDCAAAGRSQRTLNKHGWCRYSPISAAEERWHRCRPGDIG